MTVTLVTRRTDHQLRNNPLIKVVSPERLSLQDSLGGLLQITPSSTNSTQATNWIVLGHDIENRFTLPEVSADGLLLSSFCEDGEHVLTIDNTSVSNSEVFSEEILKRCVFVAHNADHEARWGVASNFLPARYICTMVNDKRLLSGADGYRFDLISVINRRLGYHSIPVWMEKDIRSEFKDCEFFFDYHILYNAADTVLLKKLAQIQSDEAAKLGQSFLNDVLNSRIIIPIAKAEITGIKHNSEKWLEIAKERQIQADQVCERLNNTVITEYGISPLLINPVLKKEMESKEKRDLKEKLRKEKLELQLKRFQESGKTHLKAYQVTLGQLNKFNTSMPELAVVEGGPINWGSNKQVLKVFELANCPAPEAKDKKTKKLKAGVGKEARTNWFVNNESSPFLEFVKSYDKFKKLKHNISSFGPSWVEQYVRNGRVYTQLDQAGAGTGRFSSGSKAKKKKDKRYANLQQIPSREGKQYRECFLADPGRRLVTLDFTNCEGSVMGSLSRDLNIMKILKLEDSHSYLGTKCWRNVYKHRYNKTGDTQWLTLSNTYEMNKSTPEKNKERDTFKNSGGLFPVAYGVASAKVGATSKIPLDEAQVMIDTIKAEIPDVIAFLDSKSAEAIRTGCVVHNDRSGSRRWFTSILDSIHYGFVLSKSDKAEVESASRNSPIQGTNSCLMKEAIALVDRWATLYKQDVRFLLTVHDEAIYDVPEEQAEVLGAKIKELMKRAAKSYLIKEVDMDVDMRIADHWKK